MLELNPRQLSRSCAGDWLFFRGGSVLSIATLAAAFATGCGHGTSSPPPTAPMNSPEVLVECPAQRTIRYIVEQPGRIEPFEQTPVYSRITGFVRTVNVEIGDRIARGAVLVELDVPEMVEAHHAKEALVTQAELGIGQAEQAVRIAEASLSTTEAGVEVARAAHEKATAAFERWRSEYKRTEQLFLDKIVNEQSRDEMRNQARAAEAAQREAEAKIRAADAAVDEARARLARAKVDRQAADNHLRVAESDEKQAAALLGYSRLVAPYDGVIADRQVHTGHFLNAGTGGTAGGPLLVMMRTDKVRVFVEVPEADAVRVSEGNSARIRVQTLNDREFAGTVTGVSWSLDPGQRTLRAEIDFDNQDDILRPGMYVHALIAVERPNTWVIPSSAVLVRDGVTFCYQVSDGKTHRLPLRLGFSDGKFVEIAKIQTPPRTAGDRPTWVDPTGTEEIVVTKPGELMDNQPIHSAKPVADDAAVQVGSAN